MARPKKDESIRRTKNVMVRFTDVEYALVSCSAEQAGYPVAVYVRKQAITEKLHVHGTQCFASLQKTKHSRCCRPLDDCPDQIPCEAARYLPRKAFWEKACALHGKVLLPVP